MIEVAFFLYDGMTALDAVGPYEVLAHRSPQLHERERRHYSSPVSPNQESVTD